jgi:uncharacterized membrane protein|tara:strand:- start:25033 stop:25461 length:429 start_codon:yes stop_codon:yes gene_type:complete
VELYLPKGFRQRIIKQILPLTAFFIISAIGGVIAYLTGEGAEETVENIQGVIEATIEQHEEFALFALIALILLGVTSILGFFLTMRKSPLTRTIAFVILFISLISFGLVARTGYLGGQIRHTEINSTTNTDSTPYESDGDND